MDRPGPTPDAPILLFVHGYRAQSCWWDFVAPAFCDTYRVITFDFSGMGGSARRPYYNPTVFRDDLIACMEALPCVPSAVIAHSWGGHCVLEACNERSDLFRYILLVDSFINVDSGEPLPDAPAIGNRKVYGDPGSAIARFRLSPPQPVADSLVLTYIAATSLCPVDGGWAWNYDPELPPLQPGDSDPTMLSHVPCPVDFIIGALSDVVTLSRAEGVTDALPDARPPRVIPGAHHHVMLDKPSELIAAIAECLVERCPSACPR